MRYCQLVYWAILGAVVLVLLNVSGMMTSVHAMRVHRDVWRRSSHSQMKWTVLPLVAALLCSPLAIGVAAFYVRQVLPDLRRLEAERQGKPKAF